ncbi:MULTISPECIES: Gfo/Idh/MocA family protein [Calothrix]|uniref:Gfo/Idh/MocA family oxidoreductase n=2 Tax=Calothrix TaxID=1186 RepID=A0ABR8AEG6_9CYAN|nr:MULTISPECIES: Gfo/Idh/MocA family oxidoreductase [Calothrix]MBD2197426.1 Gfo/Idh/MocA family oxidoreductase [Calothrix parietina FACHB-288]MBD2225993.1 Gfo/Idh/MocA family oxidoreductase [Calothrix anomala FACHB-343]
MAATNGKRKIRYAVVGLGWIAQETVLPAFAETDNSQLVALFSDDELKREELSQQYQAKAYAYEDYDNCLRSGEIDVVYIALPNHLHCDYTVRAANAGVHVLCEKPMAVTEQECEQMIRAAQNNGVKLMIAYRLHFDQANMQAVEIAQSGKIGDLRIFNSVFSQNVAEGNVRLEAISNGGGTVYDMGIYCINAARYLFRDEPYEVFAISASQDDQRFDDSDEMTSAILRFPGERVANFTSSFGAASASSLQLLGTKGNLQMDSPYSYMGELKHKITVNDEIEEKSYPAGNQFAAEIIYFSDCILNNQEPEPSGEEGLADVRIIRAIYQSAQTRQPVKLGEFQRRDRPSAKQVIQLPNIEAPELVRAADPTGKS